MLARQGWLWRAKNIFTYFLMFGDCSVICCAQYITVSLQKNMDSSLSARRVRFNSPIQYFFTTSTATVGIVPRAH